MLLLEHTGRDRRERPVAHSMIRLPYGLSVSGTCDRGRPEPRPKRRRTVTSAARQVDCAAAPATRSHERVLGFGSPRRSPRETSSDLYHKSSRHPRHGTPPLSLAAPLREAPLFIRRGGSAERSPAGQGELTAGDSTELRSVEPPAADSPRAAVYVASATREMGGWEDQNAGGRSRPRLGRLTHRR